MEKNIYIAYIMNDFLAFQRKAYLGFVNRFSSLNHYFDTHNSNQKRKEKKHPLLQNIPEINKCILTNY